MHQSYSRLFYCTFIWMTKLLELSLKLLCKYLIHNSCLFIYNYKKTAISKQTRHIRDKLLDVTKLAITNKAGKSLYFIVASDLDSSNKYTYSFIFGQDINPWSRLL